MTDYDEAVRTVEYACEYADGDYLGKGRHVAALATLQAEVERLRARDASATRIILERTAEVERLRAERDELDSRSRALAAYLAKLLWGADHWGTPNVPEAIRHEGRKLLGVYGEPDGVREDYANARSLEEEVRRWRLRAGEDEMRFDEQMQRIATLQAEVKRLRAERDEARREADAAGAQFVHVSDALGEAEAEVERLREALRGMLALGDWPEDTEIWAVTNARAALAQHTEGQERCPRCGSDDPKGLDTECCIGPSPGAVVIAHPWHKRRRRRHTEGQERCPTCGLTVRISMLEGSHGCPDPYHEED